jgi:hypothetical protein
LVARTASQSSSFIRIDSVSRVMPALLTSTCRAPLSRTTASIAAAAASPAVTSRTMPRQPSCAASASLIAAAPASVVAVPTTRKPLAASASAIARPMPRDAPVTSAT